MEQEKQQDGETYLEKLKKNKIELRKPELKLTIPRRL